MLKGTITLILVLVSWFNYAQEGSYVILSDNEKITLKEGSDIFFDVRYTITTSSGKKRSISNKDMAVLYVNGGLRLSLPMKQGGPRVLQNIIAYSDSYILTYYSSGSYTYMTLFDREYNVILARLDGHGIESPEKKAKEQVAENLANLEKVRTYFDCEGLDDIWDTITGYINERDGIYYNGPTGMCPGTTAIDIDKFVKVYLK